jgi:hypothetical protein
MPMVCLKSSITRGLLAIAAGLLVVMTVGCGGGEATGTVKGKVTLDGEAFGGVSMILVSPKSGKGGNANVQSDGTFTIENPLPVDDYTVYMAPQSDEDAMAERMKQGLPPEMDMPKNIRTSISTRYPPT